MNDTTIKRRIMARERARAVYSLIAEEADNITPDACDAFWDEILKLLPAPKQAITSVSGPMTDVEARAFGLSKMPFGEFKGWPVDKVPLDRLEWYSDSKFQEQLKRYLNNPRIKQERESREDEEDDSCDR
jgi:hypothetical protein